MKKMNAEIFKAKLFAGCSNNGISDNYDNVVCYFLEDGETVEDIKNAEDNAVVFIPRMLCGEKHYIFEPVKKVPEGYVSYMSGGSYVGSCDSRFIELCDGFEILPLHDRTETWQQYDMLSR